MKTYVVDFHMKSGKTIAVKNVEAYKFEYYPSGEIKSYEITQTEKKDPIFFKIDLNQVEAITVN